MRTLTNRTDTEIAKSIRGPSELQPTPEQVVKPPEPYRLKIREYWRYLNVVRAHKGLMTFRLSPDRKSLFVDFRRYDDPKDAVPEQWRPYFQDFLKAAPVEHVELKGRLRANELTPFLALPTLKRLTVSKAQIADDIDAVLATARNEVMID